MINKDYFKHVYIHVSIKQGQILRSKCENWSWVL